MWSTEVYGDSVCMFVLLHIFLRYYYSLLRKKLVFSHPLKPHQKDKIEILRCFSPFFFEIETNFGVTSNYMTLAVNTQYINHFSM